MSQRSYTLRENKSLRRILRSLFGTTNQPYVPKLRVLCRFYSKGLFISERMMGVDYPEWHFEPLIINGIVRGEKLVIDEGYVTLHDREERYWAVGTPPLSFLQNDPRPVLGGWQRC